MAPDTASSLLRHQTSLSLPIPFCTDPNCLPRTHNGRSDPRLPLYKYEPDGSGDDQRDVHPEPCAIRGITSLATSSICRRWSPNGQM